MRRLLTILVLAALIHVGYHLYRARDLDRALLGAGADYSVAITWARHRFDEISRDVESELVRHGPDLSQGAAGLRWASTPQEVISALGSPDESRWLGGMFKLTFEKGGLILQFRSPERREALAKLYSVRLSKPNTRVTDGVHVGQRYEEIAEALESDVSVHQRVATLNVSGIRVLCSFDDAGQCTLISVINLAVGK